nr:MAG TPA: hypothetical protein [Caudoviricetes sp.]
MTIRIILGERGDLATNKARVDKVRRETIRALTHSILDLLYINIKQNKVLRNDFVALNRIRSFSRPRRKFLKKD